MDGKFRPVFDALLYFIRTGIYEHALKVEVVGSSSNRVLVRVYGFTNAG